MMLKTSVDIIRYAYPYPTRGYESMSEYDYCVGGAFCLYMSDNDKSFRNNLSGPGTKTFPTLELLTNAIMLATSMNNADAADFAQRIIECNDIGEYSEAWNWLDKALGRINEEDNVPAGR